MAEKNNRNINKSESTPLRFGIIQKNKAPYWGMVNAGFQEIGRKLGITFSIEAPEYEDIEQQVQIMEKQIDSGVDGIAFVASDPFAFNAAAQRALHQGIPVITLDLDAPESGRFLYVGTLEPLLLGRQAGQIMVDLLGGKGKIAVQTGSLTARGALEKMMGFREIVDAHGIEVIGGDDDGEHIDIAYATAERYLHLHPEIDGMFGTYAYHSYVQAKAAEKLGRDDLKIVGFDMLPETFLAIQKGKINASIWVQEYYFGFFTGAILFSLVKMGVDETLALLQMDNVNLSRNALRLQPKAFTIENIDTFNLLGKISDFKKFDSALSKG